MAIYGECISASGRAPVLVSGLAPNGCDLSSEATAPLLDGDLLLWIGAIGPLAMTAVRKDDRSLSAHFAEPLDDKIVAHFNCG